MSHPSDILFERMREVIEAPGYPLLTDYKQDFYKHDRSFLQETFAENLTYLWIVRSSGTHLYLLYIDPRCTEEALAVMQIDGGRNQEIYLVKMSSLRKLTPELRKITPSQAKDELAKYHYEVRNGFVMKLAETNLGHVEVDVFWERGQRKTSVHYTGNLSIEELTARDRVALKQIAISQAIAKTQSLFTPVMAVSYNGDPLFPIAVQLQEECEA